MERMSDTGKMRVGRAWGDPLEVARVAFLELAKFPGFFASHSEQRDYALITGVIAAQTASLTVEVFISSFEKEVLSEVAKSF